MKGEALKGHLDVLLLSSLEHGPRHGYAIIDWLQQRSGGEIKLAAGTLYPALHRLEADGLVRGQWHEATAGERRRRMYALTKKGERAMVQRQHDWIVFSGVMKAGLGGSRG
ncbi:MAG: PadR family transcriptional regulator [Polyangia bacterium]